MTISPQISLGELLTLERRPVTLVPDEMYAEIGTYSFGRGIFHKTPRTGAEVGDKKLFVIRDGDFILQITFAWEGAVALASKSEDGMYGSVRFLTFRLDEKRCYPPYLVYYFRTHGGLDQLGKISPGSAGRNRVLSVKRIPEVLVPLPSVGEQRRIVARIDELSAKIEEARSLRDKSIIETDSLFAAGIDPIIEDLARTYEVKNLIDLVESDRGISYGVVLTGTPVENGIPTLRAGNLQKYRVVMFDVKRIDANTEAKYRRTRLRGNELLLRIRGGLGEVAECPTEMIGGNVSREIAVIPFTEKVLPRYGMYVLSASSNQARMIAHLRGTSYVGINLKDVRTLPMPIAPVSEQKRIIAYLDDLRAKVDGVKTLQEETAEELNALMPSILSRAFSGEL